ncbi:MAG: GAF domain-containing sensor histidine kinase [Candidatus Cloacimonetes bacterium]|nr:GAF domain-containing sensor histidine kinase [Candidatus Cloacimonadota bacterium]
MMDYKELLRNEIDIAFGDPGRSLEDIRKVVTDTIERLISEQQFTAEITMDLYRIKDWDEALNTVLRKTGEFLSVSRIFIVEKDSKGGFVLNYLWHEKSYPSSSGITMPELVSEHIENYLNQHEYYYIEDSGSIDPVYSAYLKSLDIKAALILPIMMHGEIHGYIGMDECRQRRAWNDAEIYLIRLLAEVMSHAILQKRTLNELKSSHHTLATVLDNIQAFVTVMDISNDRILYLNRYARNVFGDAEGGICWQQLHENLTGQCANCPRPGVGKYKDQEVVIQEIQNSVWKRWYHTTNTIIDWTDGKKGHLEIAFDITDRVEAENQNKQSTIRLTELNQTKDKFFSILAHDLKNPLFSLMGFAEIIRNRSSQMTPEEISEYSDLIYQSARNTYQLLQNLMVWSQGQTGKLRFKPNPVDVKNLLENIIEFVRPIAQQKNIELVMDCKAHLILNLDLNMITTALRNLITNAIKFSHSNKKVVLSFYRRQQNMCFDVADEGVGLSEEDIGKLFRIDIDHRSIGQELTENKGTGLGLIITKEFVSQHGGCIEVKSKVGEGTTITICLPESCKSVES